MGFRAWCLQESGRKGNESRARSIAMDWGFLDLFGSCGKVQIGFRSSFKKVESYKKTRILCWGFMG